eukprot:scaffold1460_cov138-Skeletonema_menzelii.AAC.1
MMASDPFACFGGDGSSSSDEDDVHTNNMEEADRLRDKLNSEQPSAITDLLHEHESSFELFDATLASGKGLRAVSAYKQGDEIMRETAVMRIPNSQPAASREAAEQLHKDEIQRTYNSLHERTQKSVMALASCNEDGTGVARTPQGVYDTNSFRLENDPKGGLFLTIARLNHSCRPNVTHFWSPRLQQKLIFAARDIDIGEELLTTYGPGQCMTTKGRREYLNEKFSFECNCEMCKEGNENGGDERMMEIQALQEDIALQSSSGTVPTTDVEGQLASVRKCLVLMKEQGIGGGAFTKSIFHHGYDISLAAGDYDGARSYLSSELTAVRDSEGIYSSKAIQIEQALKDFHDRE